MPYNVYVIELDKDVAEVNKFRKKNPQYFPGMPCFYVGQTAHSPEDRFKQHRADYKANDFARDYGLWLRHRLYKKYNPISTRQEAEDQERVSAEELRKQGYGVWYG